MVVGEAGVVSDDVGLLVGADPPPLLVVFVVSVTITSPSSTEGGAGVTCDLLVSSVCAVGSVLSGSVSDVSVLVFVGSVISPLTAVPEDEALVGRRSSTFLHDLNEKTTTRTIISTPRITEVMIIGFLLSIFYPFLFGLSIIARYEKY